MDRESFVAEIEQSADRSAALKRRIAELDQDCANLLAVGKEWQFPIYLSDMKATLNLTPAAFLPAAGVGWALGQRFGLMAAASAAAAFGAGSALEIKGDIHLRSVKRAPSPYRYAYRLHRELR